MGDGTGVFEEPSLSLRGGMPQRELRKRLLRRLDVHGMRHPATSWTSRRTTRWICGRRRTRP
ncbi:hypothetical protein [Nocardia aobensis]|uniref:hypothetical protein n=1 Tax=Nocardia aobensis TaxID=257277 RepID=UPI001FE2210D|nr:hypothetical protein [Nocardia aobensis]